MKNYLSVIFILFTLTSCFTKLQNTESEIELNSASEEDTRVDMSQELPSLRAQIPYETAKKIVEGESVSSQNTLVEESQKFLKNLGDITEDNTISLEAYNESIGKIDDALKKELNLHILVSDEAERSDIKGRLFINEIDFGTFENSYIERQFQWPIGIEIFEVQIMVEGYKKEILLMNALHAKGSLMYRNITLSK